MERVYEVSSSTRRLSGCPGGKGVSMTVQADLVKHVIFAPMCARYVMAGVEALEHRGQGADSSLCLTIPSSNLNLLTNFSISWVVGMVVWSVPVQKKLAMTPYIGQARKDRARL